MNRKVKYPNCQFSVEVLKKFYEEIQNILQVEGESLKRSFTVKVGDSEWGYDDSREFFLEYNKEGVSGFELECGSADGGQRLLMLGDFGPSGFGTVVILELNSRSAINGLLLLLDTAKEDANLLKKKKSLGRVFIAHGGDNQWRELKDHLTERHGIDVVCFETESVSGNSTKEILNDLKESCSCAIVVLTGEDKGQKTLRARENVIHELGLCQGYLGVENVCILLERGVNEFSNIVGLHQVRFDRGSIKSIFGDVVANINRMNSHKK